MKRATQRERVAKLLIARGQDGLSAHELTFGMGITRAAARIYELRKAGMKITTKYPAGNDVQATYVYQP